MPDESFPHPGVSPVYRQCHTAVYRLGASDELAPGTKTVYPCGNFSGTSSLKFRGTKGSIGHTFMVCIHTENQNQMSFYPSVQREISVLTELILGRLRYLFTDVPPQPNSPPDYVINLDRRLQRLGPLKQSSTAELTTIVLRPAAYPTCVSDRNTRNQSCLWFYLIK